jgi:CDP-diacylglycerol---glycerol-3-phosphate 3-phosphatidyltransferase
MSPATPPPHHLTASPSPVLPRPPVLNLPNLLTAARLGLAVVLFVCIAQAWWLAGAAVFALAAVTDWLDGYLARKQGLTSAFGRNFDPLVDKVLVCGAFIFLLPVPGTGLAPWMVTVVVARELVITGLRSFLENQATTFGADLFGKLKMVLQCAALLVILLSFSFKQYIEGSMSLMYGGVSHWYEDLLVFVWMSIPTLLYAMILATILSGAQYLWRAALLFREL